MHYQRSYNGRRVMCQNLDDTKKDGFDVGRAGTPALEGKFLSLSSVLSGSLNKGIGWLRAIRCRLRTKMILIISFPKHYM